MIKYHLLIYGSMGLAGAIMAWRHERPRPPKCLECGYEIIDESVVRCSECGASLTAKASRRQRTAPGWRRISVALTVCWILLAVGLREAVTSTVRAIVPVVSRDAMLWIEEMDAGPIRRILVSSPPGLTEDTIDASVWVATMGAVAPIETRIELADGRILTGPSAPTIHRASLGTWFNELGAVPAMNAAAASRGDDRWSAEGTAFRLERLTQLMSWWQQDIWDRSTHRRVLNECIPRHPDGRRGAVVRVPGGEATALPAPEWAGWIAFGLAILLGVPIQTGLMVRRNRRLESTVADEIAGRVSPPAVPAPPASPGSDPPASA